jgi:hypothetical protein
MHHPVQRCFPRFHRFRRLSGKDCFDERYDRGSNRICQNNVSGTRLACTLHRLVAGLALTHAAMGQRLADV